MADLAEIESQTSSAFSLPETFDAGTKEWTFRRDHLFYLRRGVLTIETELGTWRMLSNQCLWLGAGTPCRIVSKQSFSGISICFENTPGQHGNEVFAVTQLVRDMIINSVQWGPERLSEDPVINRYFKALFDICQDVMPNPTDLFVPTVSDDELNLWLSTESPSDLESESNDPQLAKQFLEQTGLTRLQYQTRVRMFKALELLDKGASIETTAFEVGFQNLDAFTNTFESVTGWTPLAFKSHFLDSY